MGGMDKMNEFFTKLERFAYLSEYYRPENLPEEINSCLDKLINYVRTNQDFKEALEEAHIYREKMESYLNK